MYKAYCDGALMYDSRIEELALINPVVTLEENKAGSFSFTIYPGHPFYEKIQKRKSIIEVYQDADLLFSGMCIDEGTDFYKQKNIFCEGELSYLNDSIQRPARYQGITVRGLLETYIANHNAQVEESKRFAVGSVTVTDPNDYLYCFTNMESTMQAIKEDLVDDLGGFFRIRHEGGVKYIDYLADSQNTNTQTIKIGKNLMDFTSNVDSSEIATAIIPLGAKLAESTVEGLETRLTIESVNNGLDYVYSPEAVEAYGWIYQTVEWDSVTTPEALKRKGEQFLSDIQFENMVIEAKAVDLHLTDKEIERFKLSDQIRVLSAPHGLDRYFRLTKLSINLNNPAGNTITLGKDEKVTLSARSSQASEEIKKAIEKIVPSSDILKQAAENATSLIATAMGGFIVKTENELLIMDTNDIETATKVWRWNINGLGYSNHGYEGPYELAMTMDGQIVADFIKVGTLSGNRINGGTISGTKILSVNNSEKVNIDISDGHIQTYSQSTGYKGIEIIGSLLNVYNWKESSDVVGFLGSLYHSTYGASIGLAANADEYLVLGYKENDSDVGPVQAITINQNGNGDIIAEKTMRFFNGTVFQNGTTATRKIFIDCYGIRVEKDGKTVMVAEGTATTEDLKLYNAEGTKQSVFTCQGLDFRNSIGNVLWMGLDNGEGEAFLYLKDLTGGASVYLKQSQNILKNLYCQDKLTASGDFVCYGTKSRMTPTENFNDRLLYCYEMPTPFFGDIGEANLDETGTCYIYIDDIFLETIDTGCMYQVFLQKYGEGDCYIAERNRNHFVVKGTPGLAFAWELKAKQAGYTMERLEPYKQEEQEAEINYEAEASAYLTEYERMVLNYE